MSDLMVFVDTPVFVLKRKDYVQPREPDWKPNGFWYSFGMEWQDWVRDNMDSWLADYAYGHKIEVDKSKMLVLQNIEDMSAFQAKYGVDRMRVDWNAVVKDYTGIEIHNPRGYCGHPLSWLGVWDVSSGCVWDLSIVRPK